MTRAAALLALLCAYVLTCQHGAVAVTPRAQDTVQVAEDWVELEVQSGHVALHTTLRLAPASLSGVYLLPQGIDVAAALARLPRGGLALDWEQQHHRGADVAGTVTVLAALPHTAAVTQAVAYCRGATPGCDGVLATRGDAAADGGAVAVFLFTAAPQPQPRAGSGGSRRRLRQVLTTEAPTPTPLPDCTLEVDGQATLFEGCQSVPVRPSLLYHLYYTLEDAPQGGTRWTGGLKVDAAAAGGEWAGFGYPQSPRSMLGSQAVIVKECSSCPSGASVDGYVLQGYDPSSNVAGSFPLTDASAAKAADGTLVARWTVDLPDRQLDTLLSSRFAFVYAVGDTDAQGGLLAHTAAGHPFGGMDIRLTNGMPVAAPAAAPAAAPTTQAPAASPPPPAVPSPPPPATEAAAAGAPAPACALQLAGGEMREFAACTSVPRLGTSFDLMWSLEPPPGGAASGANASLRLGLRAEAGGWVAVGFPASPGRMLGSTAVILRACPAPACPSGADVRDYFLASRTPSGVQPPGALAVSDAAAASEGGTMQGTITVQLDSVAAADPAFPILVAAGPVDSGGGVLQHFAYGTSTSNWAAGTSGGVEGEPSNVAAMKNAHGWLMAIGWTLILLGILMARHGKGVKPPLWFHLHRAIQVLGMSCTLSAFVVIFFAVRDATGSSVSAYTTHRNLGIAAMSMGLFQVTALVLRPHPGTRLRKVWQPVHHWVGRAAAVVAVANIYEGILNVRDVGTWAVATYSVVFGLIVAVGLGLDVVKLATGRDPLATAAAGGKEESGLGTPSSSEPATDKGSEGGSQVVVAAV